MGLFNKVFNKDKSVKFLMPVNGEVIDIKDIPDPVFADKMMGDGFGIKPSSNEILSPVDGEVVSIFPTNHAIGLKTKEGIEVLIHVGIDTVNLKGEGFSSSVKVGDNVVAGDLLLTVDFESIKDKVPSIITPVIFTAINDYKFDVKKGTFNAKDTDFINLKK